MDLAALGLNIYSLCPALHAVHGEVAGLDIGGQHCRRFVFLRHTHTSQRRPYPFLQAGAETSDNGAEAVELNSKRCIWHCHSERVGTGDQNENAESCGVIHPLRMPLMIRPLRRTHVVVRKTVELLCGGYKCVSRFEAPRICTGWTGER